MSEYIVRMPPDMPYEIRAELNAWYVESEPIVRCKDCAKWSYFDDDDGLRYGECAEFTAKVDIGCGHATRETGFCAWGERREA